MEIHPGGKAKLALTTMDKRLSVYYMEGQDSPLQGSGSLHVGRYYCHEQPMHSNFNTISFLFNYLLLLLLLLLYCYCYYYYYYYHYYYYHHCHYYSFSLSLFQSSFNCNIVACNAFSGHSH